MIVESKDTNDLSFPLGEQGARIIIAGGGTGCLLYTSDAADE